jgi:hypothetical protein
LVCTCPPLDVYQDDDEVKTAAWKWKKRLVLANKVFIGSPVFQNWLCINVALRYTFYLESAPFMYNAVSTRFFWDCVGKKLHHAVS